MGAGAFIEPAVVIGLLFGGIWVNRDSGYSMSSAYRNRRTDRPGVESGPDDFFDSLECSLRSADEFHGHICSGLTSPSLLAAQEPKWRNREVQLLGLRMEITSPNTRVFKGRVLSRLLRKYPFLVEAWYWALIYWVGDFVPEPW